jgi:hypothetical protein
MSSAFTAREMMLLACAFRAMESVPKINYAKMAELAGMSNHNSASNAWREIRKKIDVADENVEATANVTTPKTLKAAGRKRKIKDADADDDTEEGTPKKKRGRKPAAMKKSGNVESEKKTSGSKKGSRKAATPKDEVNGSDPKVEKPEVAADEDVFDMDEEA